jgi:hypothetical protein
LANNYHYRLRPCGCWRRKLCQHGGPKRLIGAPCSTSGTLKFRNFVRLLASSSQDMTSNDSCRLRAYDKQWLLSSSWMTRVPTEVPMPLWLSRGIDAR